MSTIFDVLTHEQQAFLLNYIRQSGDLHGDYPGVSVASNYYKHYANNLKLLEIQKVLGVPDPKYRDYCEEWPYTTKTKGSDLVRAAYLHACLCGYPHLSFETARGESMKLVCGDQCCIGLDDASAQLVPGISRTLDYQVFDMIVQFTAEHGGKAKKGNGTEDNPEASIARCYKEEFMDFITPTSKIRSLSNYYIILEDIGVIYNHKSYVEFTDKFKAFIS